MSTVERWVMVDGDGSLTLVTENDGEAVAFRGTERQEDPITLSEIKSRYPRTFDDAVETIKRVLVQRQKNLLRRNDLEIDVTRYLLPEELERFLKFVSCAAISPAAQKEYEELCAVATSRYKSAVANLDKQLK